MRILEEDPVRRRAGDREQDYPGEGRELPDSSRKRDGEDVRRTDNCQYDRVK